MVKNIWLFRRLPSISFQEFREYYENVHAKSVRQHMGHTLRGYVRNYVPNAESLPPGAQYDCVTELTFDDRAAMDEFYRISGEPSLSAQLREEDDQFLDVDGWVCITVEHDDVVNTGTR
jgi:hypothetical protein